MMESSDYKERFKAEYYQTKIRYEKLRSINIKYKAGTLDFKPSCPLEVLKEQEKCMDSYLNWLEVRAELEGIDLKEVCNNSSMPGDCRGCTYEDGYSYTAEPCCHCLRNPDVCDEYIPLEDKEVQEDEDN